MPAWFLAHLTMADLMSLDLLVDIFESLAKYQRGAADDAREIRQDPEGVHESITFGTGKAEPAFTNMIPAKSVSIRLSLAICLRRRSSSPRRTKSNDDCS